MSFRILLAMSALFVCTANAQQTEPARSNGNFQITGTVVNAINGAVVPRALVTLAPVASRGDGQPLQTQEGRFAFHNLAPGKYTLVVQARGYPRQLFEEHEGFNTAVVVGPGKNSEGIVFRLQPEGSISGTVLDEHNEPVRDARVMLFARNNDSGKTAIRRRSQSGTNDLGQYHFNHLTPGVYYVAVSAQPWFRRYMQRRFRPVGDSSAPEPESDPATDVAYPVTYYPNVTDPDSAGAIVIHPGDRIAADFGLVAVPALHITMVNANPDGQHPINPNFSEHVFGDANIFVFAQVNYGPHGEMEVSGIPPGNYSVHLQSFNGTASVDRRQDVNLSGDSELDASQGSDLEPVKGTLKLEGAAKSENLTVRLQDENSGETVASPVSESGEFTLQPQHPGRFSVALNSADGFAIRKLSATGARLSGRSLDLTGGEPVQLTIVAAQGEATVNGTVTKSDKPISGAMVVLVPDDPVNNLPLFRRDQSDSDGTFTLPQVVPGRYTVVAIQNGWDLQWASAEVLRPYLAQGTPVDVTSVGKLEIKVAAQ